MTFNRSIVPKNSEVDMSTLEVALFLQQDNISDYPYREGVQDCRWFSRALRERAFEQDMLIYIVELKTLDGGGHMLNFVNLSDKGVVFIEPQTDEMMFGEQQLIDAFRYLLDDFAIVYHEYDWGWSKLSEGRR